MAVSKLWAVTDRLDQVLDYATNPEKTEKSKSRYSEADYQALRDVLAYAKDEDKTEQEFFCEGINCNPRLARSQFIRVKREFNKTGGIQAYHGYLSFKEQDITPEAAQLIGMEFASEVWGKDFQVVVTTHLNTKHLHCHFVINSISFKDGHRCHDETSWFRFHNVADRICEKYGLHVIENPQRNQPPDYIAEMERAGEPTRYNVLRQAIDEAVACSTNRQQMEYALKEMGYTFSFDDRHKYWTITPKGMGANGKKKRPVRLYRLGDEYTRARLMERLRENQDKVLMRPFYSEPQKPKQYLLLTRADHIRRKSGLYRKYLYYCYRLGYLPNYKKPNPVRLHYLLRDDLIKLDELTAQIRLLGSHGIVTDEQLFSYQHKVESQIDMLTVERNNLRNEIRRSGLSQQVIASAKTEISGISSRLNILRREVKLCKRIGVKSALIDATLSQVLAEEEKTMAKEVKRHDQQR